MNLKRITIPLLTVMAAAATFAASPTPYDLKVNNFSELKVVDNVNVVYRCNPDSAGHVIFSATPDQASAFILQPDGTKLEILVAPEADNTADRLPTVTVFSSYLTRAENDGRGHLRIESAAPGPKLQIVLEGNGRITARDIDQQAIDASIRTGNGEIVITGKTDMAKLSSLGSGQIQADELKAREARCRITGTGSIGVNASESLTISGMGSGTVYYLGNPEIKNRTLGIKTRRLESDK